MEFRPFKGTTPRDIKEGKRKLCPAPPPKVVANEEQPVAEASRTFKYTDGPKVDKH